jgi:hypothetical protein
MRVTDKGMPPDCEKTKHWLTEGDRKLTKEVGCASHSEFICQGKKVMNAFVSLITSEMVYDDGDMYYKVNPEKYVEVLGRMVSEDER